MVLKATRWTHTCAGESISGVSSVTVARETSKSVGAVCVSVTTSAVHCTLVHICAHTL